MSLKPPNSKGTDVSKEVIDIGLEQVTLEMSKLLKDFHRNLRNLSMVNFEKPSIKYQSCANRNNLKSVSRESSPSSKISDKASVKSTTSSKKSNNSNHKTSAGNQKLNNKPVQKKLNAVSPSQISSIRSNNHSSSTTQEALANSLRSIKEAVERAKQERKTFTVCGNHNSIRKALLDRGWVEKIRLSYNLRNRDTLQKLHSMSIQELLPKIHDKILGTACKRVIMSKLLYTHQVDFYWDDFNDAFKVNNDKLKYTLINKFKRTLFSYTSKQGLCEAVKRAHWYQKPGKSVIRHPRSYSLTNNGDPKEFIEDYKTTAAISLLKWVISTGEHKKMKLISESGKIPIETFHFAIEECVKVIKKAKHEDIDCDIESAMDFQWNQFLDHYYKLVHIGNHFRASKGESEGSMVQKARYILNKLTMYFPNLEMDGMMNMWILKPVAGCRGIGIHICRTLKYILETVKSHTNMRYIIQKYIEKPLLIYNTKFDIRQWFLISSASPLTIWIYKECYLRFSSQTYNLRKLHESIHLTNNSVQCKYKSAGRDVALPSYNMWDSNEFKNYLKNIGYPTVFEKVIYPGMRQCITGAILLNQDNIDPRKNSFELYGADFMLTEDFQPWLIEINAKPALYASTPVTGRLCPQVLEDLIKVIIDVPHKPKANTGKFELLYKENVPKMPKVNTESLVLKGTPLNKEYFCDPSVGTIGETDETEPSQENIKEIQHYICKVNVEMHKALKNLLNVIEQEHKRPKPDSSENVKIEEVNDEMTKTSPVLAVSQHSSTHIVQQNTMIHTIMNALKNIANNATGYS